MSLIHNERTRLLANALDHLSTVVSTIGLLVPAMGYFIGSAQVSATGLLVVSGASIVLGVVLHLLARWTLGNLKS